uniref:Peptidase S26 domain-containing protein n=1 Tax=Kalanchoe fedtschenkoi TaxID=63787 RepID=A0A7N0TP53_KALFE
MVSPATWLRYLVQKFDHSIAIGLKGYKATKVVDKSLGDAMAAHFLRGKLTECFWNKGKEMLPTIGEEGGTLLVRKLPVADPTYVSVGDIVVLKDPTKTDNHLVRRLAAVEGDEMVSKDEKEEPFVLEEDQCWVLADNESLKPKEAYDSRIFGPVSMSDIVGRVIYCLRSTIDHGPVMNSMDSMQKDLPVLEVELNVDELAANHKG